MQKTKIGISVGVMGAVMYFASLFGGYIPMLLLAGYIFLKEENIWLQKAKQFWKSKICVKTLE